MKNSLLLTIKNLNVSVDNHNILKNFNLEIEKGQIYVIMGPNGCGKSTLSKVLVGHPSYSVDNGEILFKNQNVLALSAEDRAKLGIFLAFQYPLEIQGLSTFEFLHFSYNEKQKYLQKKEQEPLEFLAYLKPYCEKLNIREDFLYRNFNEGFSGGEKKKNEILQMFLLNPDLIILDELDSGLDIDALRTIYENLQNYHFENKEKSIIIITHNFKIFDYIQPKHILLMNNGKILKQGNLSLIKNLERYGYNFLTE